MYSVHQHWNKLKTCIVGRSYPPEFYSYITNSRVRNVMERIASETEEDYQKLITLLKSFDVNVLRPHLSNSNEDYKQENGVYKKPPMTPRDDSIMVGNNFFLNTNVQNKVSYGEILKFIANQKNKISFEKGIDASSITRVGKDLYFGTAFDEKKSDVIKKTNLFPNYRCHVVPTGGHIDGCFCPVVPGLIITIDEIKTYAQTFPDWEVIYLPDQSWDAIQPFLQLKKKNAGKWWVSGEELNDDFTEYVEHWLGHWVGYVEETVFDVNMLVIDEKNVVCNNYNKTVFDVFERYGITPHIINFRHRYFWDGGLHCITSDIDREGVQQDYFPQRE